MKVYSMVPSQRSMVTVSVTLSKTTEMYVQIAVPMAR